MARLKPVLQAKGRSLPGERIGKLLFNLLCSPPLQYVFPAQSQCRTLGLIQLFLPSLEVAGTDNFSWNPLIIKLEQYRSEERRVGKEGRGQSEQYEYEQKTQRQLESKTNNTGHTE